MGKTRPSTPKPDFHRVTVDLTRTLYIEARRLAKVLPSEEEPFGSFTQLVVGCSSVRLIDTGSCWTDD